MELLLFGRTTVGAGGKALSFIHHVTNGGVKLS